jgi:hypothetical protein
MSSKADIKNYKQILEEVFRPLLTSIFMHCGRYIDYLNQFHLIVDDGSSYEELHFVFRNIAENIFAEPETVSVTVQTDYEIDGKMVPEKAVVKVHFEGSQFTLSVTSGDDTESITRSYDDGLEFSEIERQSKGIANFFIGKIKPKK